MDIIKYINDHIEWSEQTFGPGKLTAGIIKHIRQETIEVEENPDHVAEWINIIILAIEGATRRGFTPEEIVKALIAKQMINKRRTWPPVGSVPDGEPVEHVRERTICINCGEKYTSEPEQCRVCGCEDDFRTLKRGTVPRKPICFRSYGGCRPWITNK